MSTAIQWTDETWNPVTGCTKVSPGCANCYIERTPAFRMTGQRFVKGKIPVRLHPDRLDKPLHWRKPRRVFVVSMGDLFHEDVSIDFIRQVFRVMEYTPHHTYQLLTKRPERALRDWKEYLLYPPLEGTALTFKGDAMAEWVKGKEIDMTVTYRWPPNVWLGVSVENQRMADERIPLLLETPAAVRFLSCEPLLGPLDLTPWLRCHQSSHIGTCKSIDWVIVGGESGPGGRKLVRRVDTALCALGTNPWMPKPHALEWLRSIRDQCQGVPFFFKQWGGPTPKSGGRLLDGHEHNEMPA